MDAESAGCFLSGAWVGLLLYTSEGQWAYVCSITLFHWDFIRDSV